MAGLAAAHRLKALGCRVVVFEATDRPGGQVRTLVRDGWVLDLGATTVADPPEAVRSLLTAAGTDALVSRPPAGSDRRYLIHEGRLMAVPTTTAEMIASPLLSVSGRLRMVREPFIGRGAVVEESAAAFARRRFGEEASTRFFEPLVASTSGGDPELLLAEFAFPKLVEFERRAGSILKGRMRAAREARRTGAPRAEGGWSCHGGLGALADRLATSLGERWRPGEAVTAIAVEPDAVTVVLDGGASQRVQAIVVALPAAMVGALIQGAVDGARLSAVAAMPHASQVVAALGYRREDVAHPLDGHGVLAGPSEGRRILGVQFTSTLFPDRAPAGHVLLTVTIGGTRHPGDVGLDDAAILEVVQAELGALLGVRGEPVVGAIGRWPAALPLAMAGHRTRLEAAATVEMANGALAFAGAWHDGLALGGVMQGGIAAAERVVGRLNQV